MTQSHESSILAPAKGELLKLENTNDKIFSAGIMGLGFGLNPTNGEVYAPVSGQISMIAETKHAIGIVTPDGLEVLVHMGIDTVSLKGKGFEVFCQPQENIQAGSLIAKMDLETIAQAELEKTIMVIVTNSSEKLANLHVQPRTVQANDLAATAVLKEAPKLEKQKLTHAQLATQIISLVGGKNNIASLIHCITRLRFSLKDESLAKTDEIKELSGVIDVMRASGQYQIVIGNEVTQVFDAIMKQLGPIEETTVTNAPQGKLTPSQAFGNLIGFITGSMSPVVGVIAASGIIKGILALLTLPQLGALLNAQSTLYITLSAIADSAFFLPILVGFSAAKKLDSDPIIAAVIGGFLTYPQMITWGKEFKTIFSIGHFDLQFLNYTYSIFPMIVAAWLAKKFGDWFKKILPSYLQMIFVPLLTVLIVSLITLLITGPIIQGLANGIADIINMLVHTSGWVGGLIIGGCYQLLVIFGLHWGVVPLITQQIAQSHESSLNALVSVSMIAQGAAVLAVAIKSKKDSLKELGFAAAISAFCGVTEPAIYGVNLRYKKVFISGLIGSAFGGLIVGLMHGTMYGFTGALIGFSSFFNPNNPTDLTSFYAFVLSSVVAIVISFVITWIWGYNDQMEIGAKVEKKKRPGK